MSRVEQRAQGDLQQRDQDIRILVYERKNLEQELSKAKKDLALGNQARDLELQRRQQDNNILQQDIANVKILNQQLQQQLQDHVRGMGQSESQQKGLMFSLQTHKEDMERRLQALSQENEPEQKEK